MLTRLRIPWTAGSMEVAADSHLGLGHRSPYLQCPYSCGAGERVLGQSKANESEPRVSGASLLRTSLY